MDAVSFEKLYPRGCLSHEINHDAVVQRGRAINEFEDSVLLAHLFERLSHLFLVDPDLAGLEAIGAVVAQFHRRAQRNGEREGDRLQCDLLQHTRSVRFDFLLLQGLAVDRLGQ